MDGQENSQQYRPWQVAVNLGSAAVLRDTNPNTIVNGGSIYKIEDISGDGGTQEYKKLKLQLEYELPKVSGEATVTYGIIIDNLYAPSAVAEINYSQEKPSPEYDDLDSNGNAVQAGRLDEYDNKSDYNKSDYNN